MTCLKIKVNSDHGAVSLPKLFKLCLCSDFRIFFVLYYPFIFLFIKVTEKEKGLLYEIWINAFLYLIKLVFSRYAISINVYIYYIALIRGGKNINVAIF